MELIILIGVMLCAISCEVGYLIGRKGVDVRNRRGVHG